MLARRWARRIGLALAILVALYVGGRGYRAYKGYMLFHTIAEVVHKLRTNVIESNGLIVNEPFSMGDKPEWWHSQWLIVPMMTPVKKVVAVRVFLKSSWLGHHVQRIEIGCMFHDPKVSKELEPYGIEERYTEVRVNNIPAPVVLCDRRVDLRHWFPGSFEEEGVPRRLPEDPDAGADSPRDLEGVSPAP